MTDFYSFKVDLSEETSNVLICYYAGIEFTYALLKQEIRALFPDSFFTKNIILITASYNKSHVEKALLDPRESLIPLKESINSYKSLSLDICFVDSDGGLEVYSAEGGLEPSGICVKSQYERILSSGISCIAKNRNLILQSSSNYHYVKPSGKHSSHFIKASNVLEAWPEVSFIALNLLQLVPGVYDRIYIDTPGIYQLAYELMLIKNRSSSDQGLVPIHSFGSYEDVDSFDFSDAGRALILISASTSNNLAKKLLSKPGLSRANIVSIFSEDVGRSGLKSLVCFRKYRDVHKQNYFVSINSYKEHECNLCRYEISQPLSLSNKDFVFEAPKVEYYLPLAVDSDRHLRDLIHSYKDTGSFRCLYDGLGGKKNPVPEYFIDVERLVENLEYQKRIDSFVRKSFPLYVDTIIHCDDNGARDIAERIAGIACEIKPGIEVFSASDDFSRFCNRKGFLVVAGSIETGRSLLNVSRKLRELKDHPISYVVGFTKYNDPESYEKLKKDLTFSKAALGHYMFSDLERLMLPLSEFRVHSWARELDFLGYLKAQDLELPQREAVVAREALIRHASSPKVNGISEELFLRSPEGKIYGLGKNFAFWDDRDSADGFEGQAVVYFTISSILQKLRHVRKVDGYAPLQTDYVSRQLHPLIFDRFNEGIIQASILRASKPAELDYSHDDSASRLLATLLERMIANPSSNDAEALPEFLLALCVAKLQIKNDHLSDFMRLTLDVGKYPLSSILLRSAQSIIAEGYEDFVKKLDIPF